MPPVKRVALPGQAQPETVDDGTLPRVPMPPPTRSDSCRGRPGRRRGAGRFPESYNAAIRIEGLSQFVGLIRSYLKEIARAPTGKGLLEALGKSGRKVTISYTAQDLQVGHGAAPQPDRNSQRQVIGMSGCETFDPAEPGKGADSKIQYNPKQKLPDKPLVKGMPEPSRWRMKLIHSYYYAQGS